jgi:D-beta-D-heptose 7-phosphate kinase/D-beta-D-heptose 1-phosphate adenosyltransferase
MEKILDRFARTGILVIGDLMVDQYVWGKVSRISPEAPVPVVEVTDEELLLGGAANVAHNVQSLGGRVFIAGVTGRDETGKILINKLEESGLDTEGIIIDGNRPTTVKTRVIAHSQQVVRFDREVKDEVKGSVLSMIIDYVKMRLPEIGGIIISDYAKGLITRRLVKKILEVVGGKKFVAVDPKTGHFPYYRDVDLITPNTSEASFGSGVEITDERSLETAGRILLKKLRAGAVIITRGDEGMSIFEKNGKVTHIPTCAREVYDVSGAGDTVIAALTLSKAAGAKLPEAAMIANYAAGVVVAKIGTAVASRQEVLKSMKENSTINIRQSRKKGVM